VVITGRKGMGKSTIAQYLLNSLLNRYPHTRTTRHTPHSHAAAVCGVSGIPTWCILTRIWASRSSRLPASCPCTSSARPCSVPRSCTWPVRSSAPPPLAFLSCDDTTIR
jgi:hypothetical protein